MKTNKIELGVKIKSCRDCHKAQGVKLEDVKAERDVFASEVEDLLTRIDMLTEERDAAEEKLDDAKFDVDGLKEEIDSLQEYIQDRVWKENWGGRI